MLSLLCSDMYRVWHRGDSTYKYLAIYLGLIVLNFITFAFLHSQLFIDLATMMGFNTISIEGFDAVIGSPTYLWGTSVVAAGGLVGLVVPILTMWVICEDNDGGFIRTLMASRYDNLSYYLEKIVLGALHSAVALILGIIVASIGMAAVGYTFTSADSLLFMGVWLLVVWLTTWAASSIVCFVVFLTRSSGAGWVASFAVLTGFIESTLVFIATMIHVSVLMQAFNRLVTWLPANNLRLIGGDEMSSAAAVGQSITLGIDMSTFGTVALCSALILVFIVAMTTLTQARRDVA